MKFYKNDIPKMALAAIIAGLIVFIVLYSPPRPEPPKDPARLSWDEAQTMIDEYRKEPIESEYINREGQIEKVELHGFRLNAANIDEILNRNLNGIDGNRKADQLMLYFGVDASAEIRSLQLIAVGFQKDVIMKNKDGKEKELSSVFDRADPCPPNCPK